MTKHIIEFDFPELSDLTNKIWKSINNNSIEFGEVRDSQYVDQLKLEYRNFRLNDTSIQKVKSYFPYFNGNIVFLIYGPGGFNPPHIDGLSTDTKLFEYNFLVPVENPHGTTTFYLKDVTMEDNVSVRTRYPVGLTEKSESDYAVEFKYNVHMPCLFYHQKLHTAKNIGNLTRVAAAWKMDKTQTVDDIISWATNNNVAIKEVF